MSVRATLFATLVVMVSAVAIVANAGYIPSYMSYHAPHELENKEVPWWLSKQALADHPEINVWVDKELNNTEYFPALDFHGKNDSRPLFKYVNKPDSHYKYVDTGIRISNASAGWVGHLLNVTSQQWMNQSVVSISVWTHQLVVIIPDNFVYNNVSAIYVTGGGNDNPGVPKPLDEDILVTAILATASRAIGATLFQVPNEPIVFAADPTHKARGEDALVAETWLQFMNTGDPEWVSLLPMVKSVVRAMDSLQDYVNNVIRVAQVQKFLIAGASKRGWTTWLTGPVDDRVIGLMPIVFDMLNFKPNVLHQYQAYGGWTFAFADYWDLNLTTKFLDPVFNNLTAIIDPLVYLEYYTMPILVVDGTGDEFFMPDDDWYWWDTVVAATPDTRRLMVQNADHTMVTGLLELLPGADAYFLSVVQGISRPPLTWQFDQNSGKILATTTVKPTKVTLESAVTFDDVRRDFRLIKGDTPADPCKFVKVHVFGNACLNPVIWFGEDLAPVSTSGNTYTYLAQIDPPASGWRGYLIRFEYAGPNNSTFVFTTQTAIVPNTFPFPSCTTLPQGCHGQLV